MAALALQVPSLATGGLPESGWVDTTLMFRAVCEITDAVRDAFLVRLPVPESLPAITHVTATDGTGAPLEVRVVEQADDRIAVVVADPAGNPLSRGQPALVYFGYREGGALPEQAAGAGPVTSLPVSGFLRAIAGQGRPTSWDRYRYMVLQDGPRHPVHAPAFEPLEFRELLERDIAEGDRPGSRDRRRGLYRDDHFVVLQGWIRIPERGSYRFALQNRGLGVVHLDGDEVVATGPLAEGDDWVAGEPVDLAPGLRLVEMFIMGQRGTAARLGWQAPGSTNVVALPPSVYAAPVELMPRIERADYPLHAALAIQPGPGQPFAFRGLDTVFVPVVLENRSRNWTGRPVTATWFGADGRPLGTGERLAHVFAGSTLHPVSLEVRDALGFTASARQVFDARLVEPQWVAIDARLLDVPAVCYAGDLVMPMLHLTGQTPPRQSVELRWRVDRGGKVTEKRRPVTLTRAQSEVVSLGRYTAGELDRLSWELVAAGGIRILSGSVRFLRPPFAVLPESAEGDALLGPQGERIVLIPHRYAGQYRQPPITEAQAFGHVVCIDDMLTRYSRRGWPEAQSPFARVLARIVNGPDHPAVTVVSLEAVLPRTEAYAPLEELVALPRQVRERKADVAVLSIGLGEILRSRSPDRFERHMAALSDLISTTLQCPVVWVTPPPYGPQPERVRRHAAAVQRVADARAIPVADLYSALVAMHNGTPVFAESFDLDLTPEAEIYAARIVARAMLAGDTPRHLNLRTLFPW